MKLVASLLFVASGLFAQTTAAISDVRNSGSFDTRLSPGTLATIYGSSFGTSKATMVTIGGKQAAVLYAADNQFSIQIPVDLSPGATTITLGNSAPFNINLLAYAPALFTAAQNGMGALSATHASGDPVTASNPASSAEAITIYATGLGATNPSVATGAVSPSKPLAITIAQPTVTIDGQIASVSNAELSPGQVGFYQLTVQVPGSGITSANPTVVLSVGGAMSNPTTLPYGTKISIPTPVIGGVVSATGIPGSVQPNIESGSWVAIYGTDLGPAATDWTGLIVNGNLPTSIKGVGVTIGGKQAYTYFVSPGQINVQAPDGLSGTVDVVVTNNGQMSAPAQATAVDYAPALFQWGSTKYAITTRYPDNAYVANPNILGAPYVAAKAGDVLILWATGFGATSPLAPAGVINSGAHNTNSMVTATVAGNPVKVIGSALSSGLVGVYQIAIQLPTSVPTGDVLVRASIAGATTPDNVYLYVSQ